MSFSLMTKNLHKGIGTSPLIQSHFERIHALVAEDYRKLGAVNADATRNRAERAVLVDKLAKSSTKRLADALNAAAASIDARATKAARARNEAIGEATPLDFLMAKEFRGQPISERLEFASANADLGRSLARIPVELGGVAPEAYIKAHHPDLSAELDAIAGDEAALMRLADYTGELGKEIDKSLDHDALATRFDDATL